jgi:hypothetical protein
VELHSIRAVGMTLRRSSMGRYGQQASIRPNFIFHCEDETVHVEHRPTRSYFQVFEIPAGFALEWEITDGPT